MVNLLGKVQADRQLPTFAGGQLKLDGCIAAEPGMAGAETLSCCCGCWLTPFSCLRSAAAASAWAVLPGASSALPTCDKGIWLSCCISAQRSRESGWRLTGGSCRLLRVLCSWHQPLDGAGNKSSGELDGRCDTIDQAGTTFVHCCAIELALQDAR